MRLLVGVLLFALCGQARAESVSELLTEARRSFEAGAKLEKDSESAKPHFLRAAKLFGKVLDTGLRNPELYLARGNAWMLAGKSANALLDYHHGLLHYPDDSALLRALEGARTLVVYPPKTGLGPPNIHDRPAWLPSLRSRWVLVLGSLFYFVACLGLTRWCMTRNRGYLPFCTTAFVLVALLGYFFLRESRTATDFQEHPIAIAERDGISLRSGDGVTYSPIYETPLSEGVEARVLFRRGGWLQLELGNGDVGWLPIDSVLLVEE